VHLEKKKEEKNKAGGVTSPQRSGEEAEVRLNTGTIHHGAFITIGKTWRLAGDRGLRSGIKKEGEMGVAEAGVSAKQRCCGQPVNK